MANLRVITRRPIENDPDVFIRMCNSNAQRLRREQKLAIDQRRREHERNAENVLCAVAGAVTAVAVMFVMTVL